MEPVRHSTTDLASIYQDLTGPKPTKQQKFDSKLALLTGLMDISPVGDIDAIQSMVTGKLMTGKMAAKMLGKNIPPEKLSPEMRALLPALSAIPWITPGMVKALHGGGVQGLKKLLDKFIGTGEGHFAFGWGHYFTETEGIAARYAKSSARKHTPQPSYKVGDTEILIRKGGAPSYVIQDFYNGTKTRDEAIDGLKYITEKWKKGNRLFPTSSQKRFDFKMKQAENLISELQQGKSVKTINQEVEKLKQLTKEDVSDIFKKHGFDDNKKIDLFYKDLKHLETYSRNNADDVNNMKDRLSALNNVDEKIVNDVVDQQYKVNKVSQGQVYETELIPKGEENWFQWYDEVPDEQIGAIKKQAREEGLDIEKAFEGKLNERRAIREGAENVTDVQGRDMYWNLMDEFPGTMNEQKKAVSQLMDRAGIQGMRYPTGTLGRGGNQKGITKARLKFEGKEINDEIINKNMPQATMTSIDSVENLNWLKKNTQDTLNEYHGKLQKELTDPELAGMEIYYKEKGIKYQKALDFLNKIEVEEYIPKNYVIFNEDNIRIVK